MLFPTLGIDNCIFYARALSTDTKHFSLSSFPGLFPSENETKFACFPALYTSCTSAHDIGVACVPTFNPLHVFLCTATVACFSQPRYELERTLGTGLIPPLRMTCKITFNCLFARQSQLRVSFSSRLFMTVCFEQSLPLFGLELTWITSGTAKEPIFCRTIAFKSFLNSSGDTTASSFKIA